MAERVIRRLAAILAADVVGYSRLMGVDEAGTLARLKALRKDVFDPRIAEHGGRIVKLMGDGALVEFGSVVDAVRGAAAIQRAMAVHNAEVPEAQRIEFRMGINLGDVIVDGDDIYGDGVNVAARLETLAEPGGLFVSGVVHGQVEGKLDLAFDDLGEQQVKNIAKPVRVYRARLDAGEAAGSKPLPLPDKPSIAVLPFTNMSGDAEQEYFSDGITEDIITELSRFPTLFVIARNSSFTYKGRAAKVQEIGRELGVQYVVEGSVRRAGKRVRVTVQLVEAASGNHLWAERYDRDLDDIFAVQDEIAHTVVATVAGRLDDVGAERARRKPPGNLAAYDYLLRAYQHVHRFTRTDIAAARSSLEKAIELDPDSARSHAFLGFTYVADWIWGTAGDEALDRALASAQRAMALDDDDSWSHVVSGHVYKRRGQPEIALNYMEKAAALNPNDPSAVALMGNALDNMGRHAEAVECIKRAMRLDPFHPDWMFESLADALYLSRHYEEAGSAFKRFKEPPYWIHPKAAACYAQLERRDEAREAVAAFERAVERERREGNPGASIEASVRMTQTYYKSQDDRDHWLEGFRKAGLPV
ncbi:MAG: tetratricopeptide repeat protein [Proteobacteria bacterium]|nr:tetratricopeptide repeat protein [Pseudomonadota bacterium]